MSLFSGPDKVGLRLEYACADTAMRCGCFRITEIFSQEKVETCQPMIEYVRILWKPKSGREPAGAETIIISCSPTPALTDSCLANRSASYGHCTD